MAKWGSVVVLLACAVALATLGGRMATAAGNPTKACKRACTVKLKRGGSACSHDVQRQARSLKAACKSDFTPFPNRGKCRSDVARRAAATFRNCCKGLAFTSCGACCDANGTKETCPVPTACHVPTTPSGAFIG